MKEKIYNILFALFWGIAGFSIAFLIIEGLFYSNEIIIDFLFRYSLYSQALIGILFAYLLTYFGNSLVEEGIRFFIIKKLRIINPYSFLLGLSWGLTENLYRYSEDIGRIPLLHIFNAGIICYFVKKNKPTLGFIIAFIIHTGWNIFVWWEDFSNFFF